MASKKRVVVVVGDMGGALETVPGVLALQILDPEAELRWIIDPGELARANTVLDKAKISYERRLPSPDDTPSVIVIGTSATAVEGQIAWTQHGKDRGIPVIWVEDLFGTGSRKATQVVSPDVMLTIHPVAEEIAQRVRPGLKTVTVGKPSFARIPTLIPQKPAIRQKVREALGINDKFLITWIFGGEPAERAWSQLEAFKHAHHDLSSINYVVMPRFHPKHPEKQKLETAMKDILAKRVLEDTGSLDEVILAADFVIADWGSTDTYTSMFVDVPVATVLFPDDTPRRVAAGYINGLPPALTGHEDWGLPSVHHLVSCAKFVECYPKSTAARTRDRAIQFQELLRPGAAERIADEIQKAIL